MRDVHALDAILAPAIASARAAWPNASIDDATFVAYVAQRARSTAPADLARLHADDLFLACSCLAGDAESIAAFDRRCLAPLPKLVARNGITLAIAEEVVQNLRARLFVGTDHDKRPLLGDYDGRGALGAWVRVAAIRAASNLRRDEANRDALVATASPPALQVLDPALALVKRRYGATFEGAIRDAFAALDETERNVLRLHFTDGLNLDAIARVVGISRATAGRRMLAARTHVRDEALRLLGERIVATPAELESLLGVVRSTLDVSLAALVG